MTTTSAVSNITFSLITCRGLYGFMVFGINSTIWLTDLLLIARGVSMLSLYNYVFDLTLYAFSFSSLLSVQNSSIYASSIITTRTFHYGHCLRYIHSASGFH